VRLAKGGRFTLELRARLLDGPQRPGIPQIVAPSGSNRIQKVLERANIKLSSVASDVLGKSSRSMIEAIIAGETDPEALSALALRKMKQKKDELKRALHGLIGEHQKLMLKTQLRHIDELDALIQKLDEEIKRRMHPFEEDLERLDTIPGVGRRTAEQILAETGTDMNRFPLMPIFVLGRSWLRVLRKCRETKVREDDQRQPKVAKLPC
jgi:uncharacterized protein YllA (UPF0747 family)